LVIGATGMMGREVMRSLEGRCRLRALVHSDASDGEIARRYPRAERDRGDLLAGPAGFSAAFEDVDRVFLLTPSVPEQLRMEENALAAAVAAGVRRIVYVSSTDVGWEIELSAAHRVMEGRLGECGVEHTVIRPDYLLDNLLGEVDDLVRGRLVAPSADGRCPFVDARDVGAVAATVLLASQAVAGPIEVTGPESLSFTELAARLAAALGRPLEHVDPDPGQWADEAVSAGMAPWLAGALAEYFEVLRRRPLEASEDTRRLTGRSPHSVEEFALDVLAPAIPAMTEPPLMATSPTTHRSEHA
jgi:uncharacterized protein YbjT (DUF2867 family)